MTAKNKRPIPEEFFTPENIDDIHINEAEDVKVRKESFDKPIRKQGKSPRIYPAVAAALLIDMLKEDGAR